MLQVATRRSLSASTLTNEVNEAIADIARQGHRVKDVKFSACSFPGSNSASDDKSLLAAMIIYEVQR